MKVRFLFNDTLGVLEDESGSRKFEGLGQSQPEASEESSCDSLAGDGVSISNVDVDNVGM